MQLHSLVWLAWLACAAGASAAASDSGVGDEHAAHRAAMSQQARVSTASYVVPDVVLQRQDGSRVQLRELLAPDRDVAVNFIFTTCTTICPVMTATTRQLQRELAAAGGAPEFVSISIDPQLDSAPVLQTYAEHRDAHWTFLTGSAADVAAVLRAFDAWRGGKSNHVAVMLFRRPHRSEWIRVEGLASSQTLAAVWRESET